MSIELNKLLEKLIENISVINTNDIPSIDLYMDQVTTFMDSQLGNSKRTDEDKILTKTMINNYTKYNLIPPPEKKKYSKEHVLLLTFIYYFKNIISINDIKKLLTPLTTNYFKSDEEFSLEDIYTQIFDTETLDLETIKTAILTKITESENTFQTLPKEDAHYLQQLSLICSLTFDVYIKKRLIESMIDTLVVQPEKEHTKHEKTTKETPKDKNKTI